MVELYKVPPISHMRAARLLEENLRALMKARHLTQRDLAGSIINEQTHRPFTEVWLSGILRGERGFPLKYLDKMADALGVATYQLFQPGIAAMTERRKGYDRRSGTERRVSHAQRQLRTLAAEVEQARHPQPEKRAPHEAATQRAAAAARQRIAEVGDILDRLFADTDLGGQAIQAGQNLPKTRARRRAPRGSVAPKS